MKKGPKGSSLSRPVVRRMLTRQPWASGGRRLGPATLFLLPFVASCDFPNDAVVVENRSSGTVILVEQFRDSRIRDLELRSGEADLRREECVDGDCIVESLDGDELARRPGPFCRGGPPWIIDDALLGTG